MIGLEIRHLQKFYTNSIGRVTFSWKSWATAYAIVFYCLATIVVIVVGQERLLILQTTKKFDDKIYAIVFVIFLVPHFWIPFVGWGECFTDVEWIMLSIANNLVCCAIFVGVANQVGVYKTMWGTFQVRYYRVTGKSLQFPRLKILIVIISSGCLLCAILFLLALNALLEGGRLRLYFIFEYII